MEQATNHQGMCSYTLIYIAVSGGRRLGVYVQISWLYRYVASYSYCAGMS